MTLSGDKSILNDKIKNKFHVLHKFSYKFVKLNRSKNRRSVIVAVTAVRQTITVRIGFNQKYFVYKMGPTIAPSVKINNLNINNIMIKTSELCPALCSIV